MKRWLCVWMSLLLALCLTACGGASTESESPDLLDVADTVTSRPEGDRSFVMYDPGPPVDDEDEFQSREAEDGTLDPDGIYTARDDVALYLHLYGRLPGNFITKKQAQALGWTGGSLEPYAPGKCIGGDYFGNYEGLLPRDRSYHECDIDTLGAKSRGAKRLVFSRDGLIYYTADHYNTFTLLYGDA